MLFCATRWNRRPIGCSLYTKASPDKAVPSYQGHAPMENRIGFSAAEASWSSTAAERVAALKMLDPVVGSK